MKPPAPAIELFQFAYSHYNEKARWAEHRGTEWILYQYEHNRPRSAEVPESKELDDGTRPPPQS